MGWLWGRAGADLLEMDAGSQDPMGKSPPGAAEICQLELLPFRPRLTTFLQSQTELDSFPQRPRLRLTTSTGPERS